jgi:hypothetical protein
MIPSSITEKDLEYYVSRSVPGYNFGYIWCMDAVGFAL